MSNDIVKQYTPYVGPDTLRAVTHSMKKHFDSYTNKHLGYEDINGSKYNGTIDNYGSEILLESRKLLMHKPSLKNILIDDTTSFYFNIQYSELINTYDQQYMLVCLLNKDALLSSDTYYIQFEDCDEQYILRAESLSDPNVYRGHFIHTNTPPKLIIENSEGETSSVDLIVNDSSGEDTDYYFYINPTTESFVDSFEDGVLKTINITDDMYNLPFIWICVNTFHLYPTLNMTNNEDYTGKPLLTIGTDGNDMSQLYPFISGATNIPTSETLSGEWYIKIKPKNDVFVKNRIDDGNYLVQIDKIQYINCENGIHSSILYTKEISYDDTFVNFYLSKDVTWKFDNPKDGDDDYDGTTYINPVYAYIELSAFENNIDIDNILIGMINAKFDKTYRHEYSELCNNAVVGIHLDSSTDYVGNGIVEQFGSTHHLGDFDGLPRYLKYELPRNISRNHVDLYAIRDKSNLNEIHIEKKQCCGLIVDSAIPQTDVKKLVDDMPINIVYDMINHKYITQGKILSPLNVVSQITYVNNTKFSNIRLYPFRQKFIYHGNRKFSLKLIDFDPELETGRVYYVSNDDAIYENNAVVTTAKPSRTMARICDIPTSFVQLINIHHYAPMVLSDWNSNKSLQYNRTFVPYSVDDCNKILNDEQYQSLSLIANNRHVFNYNENLNNILHASSNSLYKMMDNINTFIDLSTPSLSTYYEYTPINTTDTSGYNVGDKFNFNIGGVYFDGTVTSIDNNEVTGIEIDNNVDAMFINLCNLDNNVTEYVTTSKTGNGVNLGVRLTINSDYWNTLAPKQGEYFDHIHAYQFDEHNHVWLYNYDVSNNTFEPVIQLTGPKYYENIYDNISTQSQRTIASTMLNNLLNVTNSYESINLIDTKQQTSIPVTESLGIEDRSEMLSTLNVQNGYYMICKPSRDTEEFYIIQNYRKMLHAHYYDNNTIYDLFPRYNRVNISNYYPIDRLIIKNEYNQPTLSFYNPSKTYTNDESIYTNNIRRLNKQVPITFRDYFGDSRIIFDNNNIGYLEENVYRFNNYQTLVNKSAYYNEIRFLTREELLLIIQQKYPNAELLTYEATEYSYTRDMMIDFLMINYYDEPIYKMDNISLMRTKDEAVLTRHAITSSEYEYRPHGEQPTGDIVDIATVVNTNTFMRGTKTSSDIAFIFKLEKQGMITSLNDFKIYDDDNNDISEYSLLIYDNTLYTYMNDAWIPITR